jgi:hypothetical protein
MTWARLLKPGLALLLAALALSAAACGSSASSPGAAPAPNPSDGPPLELSLGDGDSLASCIQFDVAVLADMSPAFAGTVSSVDGDTVTLDVHHWYAGGDAATVTLRAPAGLQALIDGFDFQAGEKYLITAADGNVNYCGYSGLATPELTAAYTDAFEH